MPLLRMVALSSIPIDANDFMPLASDIVSFIGDLVPLAIMILGASLAFSIGIGLIKRAFSSAV